MKQIFLVTGNAGKLEEWRRVVPEGFIIESLDVDLTEIQSIDPEEIIVDKVKRAYEALKKPVVVEDVSAGLVKLGGLPGPFIKFFLKAMGQDALYKLAGGEGEPAFVTCSVAYYDGKDLVTVQGEVKGKIVKPRGSNGFGYDATFVPDGGDLSYAEMTTEQKDSVSHRAVAIKRLIAALETR